jgi:hypothetical protein
VSEVLLTRKGWGSRWGYGSLFRVGYGGVYSIVVSSRASAWSVCQTIGCVRLRNSAAELGVGLPLCHPGEEFSRNLENEVVTA